MDIVGNILGDTTEVEIKELKEDLRYFKRVGNKKAAMKVQERLDGLI